LRTFSPVIVIAAYAVPLSAITSASVAATSA